MPDPGSRQLVMTDVVSNLAITSLLVPPGGGVMSGGAGHVLSPDAIAALVDAARDGRLPEEAPSVEAARWPESW